MKRLVLPLLACCLLMVCAVRVSAADPATANDLKQIGLAYHNYYDANQKAPAKAGDLSKYLDNNKKLLDMLDSGNVVFVFGVGILDMKDGTSNTVLAYVKDIEKDGGLALYGDGSVKKLTADDFKKAIIAKPKNK
jgi:hypothetical protein